MEELTIMPKFNQDKINSIFLRMPDLRYLINQSFRKLTGICPFQIVRGITNAAETGYQPMGAEPRDYTDFEQVLDGFDPIIVDWEDSVAFPFDGTMDQRYQEGRSIKVTDQNSTYYEKEKIIPRGSLFTYEDGTEFRLDRLIYDENTPKRLRLRLKEMNMADWWSLEMSTKKG